jgi:putative endonuclease
MEPKHTRVGPTHNQTTKSRGDAAEALAMEFLQRKGLRLLARNFKTPGRGGGEVDLIMQEMDGTVVFVEVRQRSQTRHGGAAASVSWAKQRRIVFAARHYLMRWRQEPACRFDVVAVQGEVSAAELQWLRGAFEAA